MQAITGIQSQRAHKETWTEAATAALLGVVVAAVCAASYLGWMLLTEPSTLMEHMATWLR